MYRLQTSFLTAGCVLVLLSPARADDAEEKTVALVRKLGGSVTRDDKQPGKPVVEVDLSFTKLTEEVVAELSAFKGLTNLNLYRTRIYNSELTKIAALKNLTSLNLGGTEINDDGLK